MALNRKIWVVSESTHTARWHVTIAIGIPISKTCRRICFLQTKDLAWDFLRLLIEAYGVPPRSLEKAGNCRRSSTLSAVLMSTERTVTFDVANGMFSVDRLAKRLNALVADGRIADLAPRTLDRLGSCSHRDWFRFHRGCRPRQEPLLRRHNGRHPKAGRHFQSGWSRSDSRLSEHRVAFNTAVRPWRLETINAEPPSLLKRT